MNNKSKKGFWNRNPTFKSFIVSLTASITISILVPFYDYHFNVIPKIVDLNLKMDTLNLHIKALEKETNIVEKHIVERPHEGIPCKVGLNFTLKGYTASVYANNPFGLKRQNHIVMFNHNDVGGAYVYVTVITDDKFKDDADKADIYLSKDCFERLGIKIQEARRKGVYNMNYKIHLDD